MDKKGVLIDEDELVVKEKNGEGACFLGLLYKHL